ncbi:MAG: GNAT family N-acetyltransferase [Oscillospiraceae bacterium]|jgi:RimJ/RimL family protein N-acetyltransferase|nr:GNAT family N-acetyltransferase [Oscillospiraceae bacterium]
MLLQGEHIYLRDTIETDIADHIRWETGTPEYTEWMLWDAPWEQDGDDAETIAARYHGIIERVGKNPDAPRYTLQICLNDGTHIGWVNAYDLADDFVELTDRAIAVGIDIPEISARRQGAATEAWRLWIKYLRGLGHEIFTQTWSGNLRVLGLIRKLGFAEYRRVEGAREVRGAAFDALTFRLDDSRVY